MAREVMIALAVVVPDDDERLQVAVRQLVGHSLPTLPASWVTRARLLEIPSVPQAPIAVADDYSCEDLEAELDDDFGVRDTD